MAPKDKKLSGMTKEFKSKVLKPQCLGSDFNYTPYQEKDNV